MIAFALDAFALAVGLGIVAHGAWWLLLSLVALPRVRRGPVGRRSGMELVIVVPAHNEAGGLPATLRSLLAQDYSPRPRILVVADNCSDATFAIAVDSGAEAIERNEPELRGKGYALAAAIEHLGMKGRHPDAVVFIDADCTVSAGFLGELAAALDSPGVLAAQAYYRPEAGTSDLGRLRGVAFALLHYSRPLGAKRLGLPTTAKGTGMAMRWDLARAVYGNAMAHLTEDAAATLTCARMPAAFAFVPTATVTGQMSQSYADARTQDSRWERGRLSLMREGLATAASALRRGRVRPAAAALEVASLPLSMLVIACAVLLAASAAGAGSWQVAGLATGSLVAYVVAGSAAARLSWREVRALAAAPRFVLYKATVYVRVVRPGHMAWTRTRREH